MQFTELSGVIHGAGHCPQKGAAHYPARSSSRVGSVGGGLRPLPQRIPAKYRILPGKFYYVMVNGEAAVIFFFTLSGYVLTIRFFENPAGNYIGSAALKRLPRLALLPTIATVASASIWLLGLYRFQEAGHISGSRWLEMFGMSDLPTNFEPSLTGALDQGIWRTFLVGDSYYDSSLWTMVHEFHGSLLVLAVAPFLIFVLRGRSGWLALMFSMLIFRYVNPYMMPFLAGMAIAYFSPLVFRFLINRLHGSSVDHRYLFVGIRRSGAALFNI